MKFTVQSIMLASLFLLLAPAPALAWFILDFDGDEGTLPLKVIATPAIKTFHDPSTRMEFIFIKGGCFPMGDTFGVGDTDEKPVHEVCVDDFYLGKFEVTQAQWQTVMGNNPSDFKGPDLPVDTVSWKDSQDYIRALVRRAGFKPRPYRLPTEAEWEYACRSGGRTERYCGGDDAGALAWHAANSTSRSQRVGTKEPNSLGLYDMSGNVWEWCSDWYSNGYYAKSPQRNPGGPALDSTRVIRGGGWANNPEKLRSSMRSRLGDGHRYNNLGFRLAFTSQ